MDWHTLLNDIIKAVVIAAIPALTGLVALAFSWLREYAKTHIQNAILQRITNEAFEVVLAVGQAIGDDFKKAAADGKLSEDEKATLKTRAINALKLRLIDIPKHLLPNLETRLSEAIEAAVAKKK